MLRRNRDFVLLWSAETVSELGTQVSKVAFPLLVLALTGSPAKAGVVGFAHTVPIALLALPAGAVVDRVNRRAVMVACDGVRGAGLAAIAIGLAAGRLPYGLIVAVAALDGGAFVTAYIAERGVLRRIVAPEDLPKAVARNESGSFAVTIAGPALGGVLFGVGRAVPFLTDALSYAAAAAGKLAIRADFKGPGETTGGAAAGLRWIWGQPFIRACALLFAAGNPLYTGVELLIVVLAKRHGASSAEVGVMLGIVAAGGLLGGLIAPGLGGRLRPWLVLVGETVVVALVLPLLLVAHAAVLLGLIVAVAMLPTPVTNSIVVGYRVGLAPDALQGRVQAGATVISFSLGWAGPLVVGLLLEHAGASATIAVLCGWAALLAVGASLTPAFRRPPELGYTRTAGSTVSSST
jgi:MFS family permease